MPLIARSVRGTTPSPARLCKPSCDQIAQVSLQACPRRTPEGFSARGVIKHVESGRFGATGGISRDGGGRTGPGLAKRTTCCFSTRWSPANGAKSGARVVRNFSRAPGSDLDASWCRAGTTLLHWILHLGQHIIILAAPALKAGSRAFTHVALGVHLVHNPPPRAGPENRPGLVATIPRLHSKLRRAATALDKDRRSTDEGVVPREVQVDAVEEAAHEAASPPSQHEELSHNWRHASALLPYTVSRMLGRGVHLTCGAGPRNPRNCRIENSHGMRFSHARQHLIICGDWMAYDQRLALVAHGLLRRLQRRKGRP